MDLRSAPLVEAKQALRRELRAARVARGDGEDTAAALRAHVLATSWAVAGATVAAYAPIGREPGDVALLDELIQRGVRVLLPLVVGRARERPLLDWADHDGRLVDGPFGLREPAGPRLGPAALVDADVVVVPALAVDRRGVRLGQGGGFYDRSLGLARAGVPLIGLLYDSELVEALPTEAHDVRVTAVLTPSRGVIAVGAWQARRT